ncbi:hypothetical protein [Flavobacterium sp. H122]|uniref:hypothetical protein n=1 Tax=Flavobacterium sp. H122 TaxID=2529860 RepID=UPI0010AB2F00|nr:hypothetical protein [Flavobacterium sp. H122]
MEEKIKTIEDLKNLASRSFQVVEPLKHCKGRATVKIPVNSYIELSYYIIDVIKVSVAALDAESADATEVRDTSSAISGVLNKLIEIIPLEEMDLLDKIQAFITDDSHKKS